MGNNLEKAMLVTMLYESEFGIKEEKNKERNQVHLITSFLNYSRA